MRLDSEALLEQIQPFLIKLGEGIGDPAENAQGIIDLVGRRYSVLAKACEVDNPVIQRGLGQALTFRTSHDECLYTMASRNDSEVTMTRLSPALIRIAMANPALADQVVKLVTARNDVDGLYDRGQDHDEAALVVAELKTLARTEGCAEETAREASELAHIIQAELETMRGE